MSRIMAEKNDEEVLPRPATTEEIQSLVHEPNDIPTQAWLLTFTGAASQFVQFENYLQNPRGNPQLPGELSLGQAMTTTIQNSFLFFQYMTPLLFAVVSDTSLGRYRTMLISFGLLVAGYIIMFITSLPAVLDRGAGVGGIITTMVLISLGHEELSAAMHPFIGDQIAESIPKVKRNKKGDLVVTDRKLAIQSVFNGYYW
ncbi:hypothetical protein F4779DRAFT_623274 [Xylariaceae sp. FL0662B]|nr:hypothetical protein F4779DRAFT_623274 [Xylariaceae sp. FL0662B]